MLDGPLNKSHVPTFQIHNDIEYLNVDAIGIVCDRQLFVGDVQMLFVGALCSLPNPKSSHVLQSAIAQMLYHGYLFEGV